MEDQNDKLFKFCLVGNLNTVILEDLKLSKNSFLREKVKFVSLFSKLNSLNEIGPELVFERSFWLSKGKRISLD